MASYLYRPPTYKVHRVIVGALRYHVRACTTVYRIGGVWHNVLSPGMGNPSPADCDVESTTGLLCYFNTPTSVPDTLFTGLSALSPADPSWSAGVLTLQ